MVGLLGLMWVCCWFVLDVWCVVAGIVCCLLCGLDWLVTLLLTWLRLLGCFDLLVRWVLICIVAWCRFVFAACDCLMFV